MTHLLTDLAASAGSAGPGLAVKSTVLVAAAVALTALLRQRSAAARHFVWALALWGTLALLVATPFSPAIPVPVPAVAASIVTPTVMSRNDVLPSVVHAADQEPAALSNDALSVVTPDHAAFPRVMASTITLVAIFWLGGTVLLLAWLGLGHLGLFHLARRATPVQDQVWHDAVREAARAVGVTRRVRLARSGAVGAPITWGVFRPIIVVPPDADAWSPERRRVVLLHELSHIARGDFLLQLGGSVACALYWFNPTIWMAMRRLRNESERACDDRVLDCGTAAPDYATHLLSVAQGSRALRLTGAVAIGMARRSALEGRLLAVLDTTLRRNPLSSGARRLSIGALGMLVIPLAGMQAGRRAPEPQPRRSEGAEAPAAVRLTTDRSSTDQEGVPAGRGWSIDSTFERSIAAAPGERLTLDLRSGGDVTVRGWEERRVSVRGRLGGRDFRDQRVQLERDGNGVILRVTVERDGNTNTSNSFDIRVPTRFDVRVSSAGGEVSIVDVDGTFRGTTGGGGLTLERVQGRADLSIGGGEIRVVDSELDGSVRTGGGLVRISGVRGNLSGSSGGGPVIYAESESGRRATGDIGDVRADRSENRVLDERDKAQRDREESRRLERAAEKVSARERGAEARESAARQRGEAEEEKRAAREREAEDEKRAPRERQAEDRKPLSREREATEEIRDAREREVEERKPLSREREAEAEQRRAREAESDDVKRIARDREQEERRTSERAGERREFVRELGADARGILNIEKAGGDVELPEAPYGARIITGGGTIRVGRATGPLDVSTGGGDITIGPAAGSVRAGTGAGTIHVTVADGNGASRTVELTSGNGRMIVDLPADFDGRFELETSYTRSFGRTPRITSDWELEREPASDWNDSEGTPRRYVRAHGTAGRGRGMIFIKTVNGDIELRRRR